MRAYGTRTRSCAGTDSITRYHPVYSRPRRMSKLVTNGNSLLVHHGVRGWRTKLPFSRSDWPVRYGLSKLFKKLCESGISKQEGGLWFLRVSRKRLKEIHDFSFSSLNRNHVNYTVGISLRCVYYYSLSNSSRSKESKDAKQSTIRI